MHDISLQNFYQLHAYDWLGGAFLTFYTASEMGQAAQTLDTHSTLDNDFSLVPQLC